MPRYAFIRWTCLGHYCSVQEKAEFVIEDEDVIEVVEKFCYLGDMPSSCGGESEAVSARIDKSLESLGS